tara:strand:+ start:764 stop:1093 length:330 start_codon:yes stop_codon:yes gene_type:complete
MADEIKVLGQVDAAATTTTVLYTVPNLNQTTVSSLVVCNRTGHQRDFRVSVHVDGATANDKQFLYYNLVMAANTTFSAVLGLTLNQGDVVKVYASDTGLSFNMFGVETS